MNKLVKKSLAGVLAGVMAATSLVGSISAFALTDEDVAFKKDASVGSKITFEYNKDGAQDVYAFKTGKDDDAKTTTIKYTIAFSSDEVFEADTATEKNKRKDSAAKLTVFEADKDVKTYTKITKDAAGADIITDSYKAGPTTKRYFVDTNKVENLKSSTYSYVYGVMDIDLKEETTYLFTVEKADFGTYTEKVNGKDETKYTKAYLTINNYVKPAEAIFALSNKNDTDTLEIKEPEYANGTYYTTKVTSATATATYTGTDGDIVVPDTIVENGVEYRITKVNGVDGMLRSGVKSLTLGKNVKSVGGFNDCARLAKVDFNEGLETIEANAFRNCAALTGKLVVPATVTTIGANAFYNTNYDCAEIKNEKTDVKAGALGIVQVLNEATAIPTDVMDAVKDGFFITAPAKAEKVIAYGKANGIPVVDPANCTHVFGDAVVKAATIYAAGSETKTCAICGKTETKEIAQKKVAIASVKSAKKGQITVKTKAVTDKVTAYKVQYSTDKNFKKGVKTVTVKTSKKALSKTIKGLKAGKKYYVRVKAVNGSKKSAFTAKKAVTVKK